MHRIISRIDRNRRGAAEGSALGGITQFLESKTQSGRHQGAILLRRIRDCAGPLEGTILDQCHGIAAGLVYRHRTGKPYRVIVLILSVGHIFPRYARGAAPGADKGCVFGFCRNRGVFLRSIKKGNICPIQNRRRRYIDSIHRNASGAGNG